MGFPGFDPFKGLDEKLDRKFAELTKHIDKLIEAVDRLAAEMQSHKETMERLTTEIQGLRQDLQKKP